ncbi:MAG: hypothetical protein PHD48_08780 [Alphaproteobacteria bacterium]|nr:hypothetical protein [Alphaproteobacteria bacterium]
MHRNLAIFCVALVLIMGGRVVAAATMSLDDLTAWVGKYPADLIEGKTLWDNESLKADVLKYIGPKTQDYIFNQIGRQVASPVQIKDDVLYVSVCQAHACSEASARVFIDLKKKKTYICWRYATEKQDLWLSAAAEPKAIGEAGCGDLDPFDLFAKYGKD